MGAASYELRIFHPLPNDAAKEAVGKDLLDIYIYKRGFSGVGVKYRNPHLTNHDNYKLKRLEVKQLQQETQSLQKWSKHVMKDQQFVLKQEKLDRLNDHIRDISKQLQNRTEQFQRWLEHPIDKVICVSKNKSKDMGSERAVLEIFDLFNPTLRWRFSSEAYESDKFQELLQVKQQKNITKNTSYPQLLESLFAAPHVAL